jgi:hypothetical protein
VAGSGTRFPDLATIKKGNLMEEDFRTEDDIASDEVRTNLDRVGIPTLNMVEMTVYYKGNSKIVSRVVELAKTRKRLKKTKDSQAKKPIYKKIEKLKKEIKDFQLDHYKKLKKISVIGVHKDMAAGVITEHPQGKIFTLKQNEPVSLPTKQARQLIKEGNALEVK